MPSEYRYATVGQNFERESELFDPRFGRIKSAWDNLYEDKENAHQPVPLIRFLEVRNQSPRPFCQEQQLLLLYYLNTERQTHWHPHT